MKNQLKSTILIIALVLTTSIGFAQKKKNKKVKEVVYKIEMDCANCVKKIEKNIAFEKGVKSLKVNFKKNLVKIKYKVKSTKKGNLANALKKLGYSPKEVKIKEVKNK